MSNPPEITVKRRRKGETPTGRADAPVRREVESGGSYSSSSGSGSYQSSGGGGFQMPSKGKLGGGCGGILVVAIIIAYVVFGGGLNGGGGDSNIADYPTLEPQNSNNSSVQSANQYTATYTRSFKWSSRSKMACDDVSGC